MNVLKQEETAGIRSNPQPELKKKTKAEPICGCRILQNIKKELIEQGVWHLLDLERCNPTEAI